MDRADRLTLKHHWNNEEATKPAPPRDLSEGAIRFRVTDQVNKAQLASHRTSWHSATANQVRLVLHTAAFWLMLTVRAAIHDGDPLAKAEFATIRERLIKIGTRVLEHIARIRIHLPTSCSEGQLYRHIALSLTPAVP